MSRSYKYWYRMAQSLIQYYHHLPRPSVEQKPVLLNTALNALTNALLCLDKFVVPNIQQLKSLTNFVNLQE